ncbi:MAG: hypothetical protein IPM10_13325 [Chitinophagaceae bacterium]|nr:hypothetical protein [Chitinophagaceae bacterium]
MGTSDVKRIKEMEAELSQYKKIVAEPLSEPGNERFYRKKL